MNTHTILTPVNAEDADGDTSGNSSRALPSLATYFEAEAHRPPRYLGQLAPDFQAALTVHHAAVTPADCDFYHTIETADGTVYPGAWDLRDHEAAYLGHQPLDGRSVLEFGPASGWLSAYIARHAASLTVFDLPVGGTPDMVPMAGVDMAEQARNSAVSASRLRNSWWYAKRCLGFEARAVYADIYQPPADIGQFDVTIFAAVLLHLRSPFQALQEAAQVTTEAIVVTDVFSAPSLAPLATLQQMVPSLTVFNPSPPPVGLTHWWALSPDIVQHMLRVLGFTEQTVTQHSPPHMSPPPPMFTVVGRRPAPISVRGATIAAGLPVPPPELRFLVAGTEDEKTFLDFGRNGFAALTASLRRQGIEPARLGRVLDFGCGVGRVLRHWKQFGDLEVFGTDLSSDMIAWDRENLPFATFSTNTVAPELPFEDDMFGLIYALSVFTHLPLNIQVAWWQELVRITRPGGVIYFSAHGPFYRHLLTPAQAEAFDSGEMIVTGDEDPGSNHCAAFHTKEAVERDFVAPLGLELLEYLPRGAAGNPQQDSYLIRKPL